MSNPDVVVPPMPHFGGTFVQQRRLAIVKFINSMDNHPVLAKDLDLKQFLWSETFSLEIKFSKAKISHGRGGLIAWHWSALSRLFMKPMNHLINSVHILMVSTHSSMYWCNHWKATAKHVVLLRQCSLTYLWLGY